MAATDLYRRPHAVLRAVAAVLAGYERVHSTRLRRRALDCCFDGLLHERTTRHQALSPVTALAHLRAAHPALGGPRLDRALARAARFLRGRQRADGSIPGFWGINFTYALFHFVRGLRAAGTPATDPALLRAARWLVAHQRADGGWGEHHAGCRDDRYVEHPESQVVMTSWALLALLQVLEPRAEPIARGIAWLVARQRADGSWPRGAVNGVFFRTAMLEYRLYASHFPVWALARYAAATGPTERRPVGGL